jgi:4-hydroxy-tetrahydrodipicolinate synthase
VATQRLSGVHPVLYAFHHADGRLDHAAMRQQVEHSLATGAHGIMVLGLVTEVHRKDEAARREVVEVVGEAIARRVPYAVTIASGTPDAQIAFAVAARAAGADWVILQPPPGRGHAEAELQRHFGRVADSLDMPVAVQNNPVNLDSALSPEGLVALLRAHPNITLLKAEGSAIDVARAVQRLGPGIAAFGGHGGLEFPTLLRAGAAGLIPAPDVLALQVALFEAFRAGELARMEEIHRRILPLIVFMTRSVAGMLLYGKRVMARRLGLEAVHDAPGEAPDPFALAEAERLFAAVLEAERALLAPSA